MTSTETPPVPTPQPSPTLQEWQVKPYSTQKKVQPTFTETKVEPQLIVDDLFFRTSACIDTLTDPVQHSAAQAACRAYTRALEAFNARDANSYYGAFAEPMTCFYDQPNVSVRDIRPMQGALGVTADNIRVVATNVDHIWLCERGEYDLGDGKGFRPHNKLLVMRKYGAEWFVIIETTRLSQSCYTYFPC